MSKPPIKLSSPSTREFWEITVLYEDEHLLAIDKPAGLLTSPDRYDPLRPNLMRLLHTGIAAQKPWAQARALNYLMNAHRLDFETTGILLLAKSKPVLIQLANLFGSGKPEKRYLALALGTPNQLEFEVHVPLAPHPAKPALMRADPQRGKQARTRIALVEQFAKHCLLRCQPVTGRTHQIRVHLQHARLPLCGDRVYGGRPLLLSELKPDYRFKGQDQERPLIQRPALHAESLSFPHPVSGEVLVLESPWPKDLRVAIKYLQRYTPGRIPEGS